MDRVPDKASVAVSFDLGPFRSATVRMSGAAFNTLFVDDAVLGAEAIERTVERALDKALEVDKTTTEEPRGLLGGV